jgi:mono/diheme cytochrome c family protein
MKGSMTMKSLIVVAAIALPVLATASEPTVDRGRFLITFGGCNDCHTAGYMEKEGAVPESEWLMGAPTGFQGPWGTTYGANLRLRVSALTEEQWLAVARARRLPPMPWFTLAKFGDDDLRAIYRYISSLGPAGQPAPAFVAPGDTVTTPFIVFVPQSPATVPAGVARSH